VGGVEGGVDVEAQCEAAVVRCEGHGAVSVEVPAGACGLSHMEAAGAEAKSATTASNRVISPPRQRAYVFLRMCLLRTWARGGGGLWPEAAAPTASDHCPDVTRIG